MARVDQARSFVRVILAGREAPSLDEIKAAVAQAIAFSATGAPSERLDEEALVREFESVYSVYFPSQTQVLEDQEDHVPWLPECKATIEWDFWGRYEYFIREVQKLPPQVVVRLGTATDETLAQLEDPRRPGSWDRRGLVVGNVQSGKTSNYSGLICKALDAGYKLVVVLAGMHNSLRSQTQARVDQAIIGFDTSKNPAFRDDNQWIGVGAVPWKRLRVNALTNSLNDGDFNNTAASKITTSLGGDPYVLVVKKNSRILKNLIAWALHANGKPTSDGRSLIRDVPLLVIDDEADNASINTNRVPPGEDPNDYSPSSINAKIRELLTSFEQRAYVGYTATPFANIFVPADASFEGLEDDIFPRSFIHTLSEPTNYVGPARVFGLTGDPDAGIEPQEGFPIVVPVSDAAPFFPDKYRKDHDPGGLPPSLSKAIRVFVLSAAARRARGQARVHNSMLIHIARFQDVQARIADYVREELNDLTRRIRYGSRGDDPIWEELLGLWTEAFIPVWSNAEIAALGYSGIPWELVKKHVRDAVEPIQVKVINGQAADILDYQVHPEGISVVVIGGDKLSRGLTLEGLTVSYYLRASRMYDTLMQMGRWFGYRDNYLDLCRLYTTDDLRTWYRYIALVDIELRREFQSMVDQKLTPTQYGLRVRKHPGGLLVTALNKSRYTTPLSVSFAGRLVQTKFLSAEDRDANTRETISLLNSLSSPTRERAQHAFWGDVSYEWVCRFLQAVKVPHKDVDAHGGRLAEFIKKQVPTGGLTTWGVLLSGGAARDVPPLPYRGNAVAPVVRSPADELPKDRFPPFITLRKANILDPRDQSEDFKDRVLTAQHFEDLATRDVFRLGTNGEDLALLREGIGADLLTVALRITRARHARGEIRPAGGTPPSEPNGKVVRDLRESHRGLLIIYPTMAFSTKDELPPEPRTPMIGYALSFPAIQASVPVEYLVNQVYEQLRLFDDAVDANN